MKLLIAILSLCFSSISIYSQCDPTQTPYFTNVIDPNIDTEHETGWRLFDNFSDEFNGNSSHPDLTKWYLNDDVCAQGNYPIACYQNYNLPIVNGKLHMIIREEDPPIVCDSDIYYYSVGSMTSKTKLHYGYIEAMVTFPNEANWRFAFWTFWYNDDFCYYDEIDIIEFDQYNSLNVFTHSLHYKDHWPKEQINVWCHDLFNENHLGKTYLFAVEWLPNEVHWFINGDLVFSKKFTDNLTWISDKNGFTCSEFANPHPQVIYLSGGPQEVPANLYEHYEVDYVHTYKLEEGVAFYWPDSFNPSDLNLFKVHNCLHLGGDEKTAVIPASGEQRKFTVWATDSIILDKGFSTELFTNFTARTIKNDPEYPNDIFNQAVYPKDY